MNTDVLNTNLIEVMKEKIPDGGNLANTLMDILYIGKRPYTEDYAARFPSPSMRLPSFQRNWEFHLTRSWV